ncbi:MAG: hypothetical protein KGQ51_07245 [Planctomycetes bacterium]|nr:hypothetical protein [Planctomycetota bacterium]
MILIDIAGAFLTSLILLVLLATNNLRTGMPIGALIFLGVAAAMLGSFGTYRLATSTNHLTTLGILAFLNLDFCILSGVLWWNNLERLTLLGRVYFPAEIVVILILATIELRWSIGKS